MLPLRKLSAKLWRYHGKVHWIPLVNRSGEEDAVGDSDSAFFLLWEMRSRCTGILPFEVRWVEGVDSLSMKFFWSLSRVVMVWRAVDCAGVVNSGCHLTAHCMWNVVVWKFETLGGNLARSSRSNRNEALDHGILSLQGSSEKETFTITFGFKPFDRHSNVGQRFRQDVRVFHQVW